MYTHTLTSICGALILAGVATVIGFEGIATARPEDGSLQIVNRTQKGDRLPLAQIKIPRAPVSDASLPEGCDSLVSSLTRSDLARIAVNWPPFRPDTRHNLEGLRLSSSTGLCLTTTNVSN